MESSITRKRIRRRRAGHVLTELAIVVGIIGLFGLLALPDVVGRAARHRRERAVSDLAGLLRAARMEAVSRNVSVEVEFDSSTKVFRRKADIDGDGTYSADEITSDEITDIDGVGITLPESTGRFNSMGTFSSGDTYWEIAVQSGCEDARYVCVNPSGHVEVGDQPAAADATAVP